MPERFKVVCIPCKALYKCSALPFTNEEVAILIAGESRAARSIIVIPPPAVDCHSAGLQVVSEMHSSWEPLHCMLLFLYRINGLHLDITKDGKAKSVTAIEY